MDPRDRKRLVIAHRVLDAMRNQSFRSETLATRAGDHVIVPALPDDTMGPLFDRLRASGGPLHVATLHADELAAHSDELTAHGAKLAVFVMVPRRLPRHADHSADPDDEFPVGRDMAVGMVIDYLILRDKPIILHEASPTISLELVEKPESVPARRFAPC